MTGREFSMVSCFQPVSASHSIEEKELLDASEAMRYVKMNVIRPVVAE